MIPVRSALLATLAIACASLLSACSGNKAATHHDGPMVPATPFNAAVIRHTVADYAAWRPYFDADRPAREAAGIHVLCVARGLLNPNEIEIPCTIDDVAKAHAFAASPRLKDVMTKGGVISAPDIKFIRVLRMNDVAKKPMHDYATVVCQVKNFDAWLKVFDREGPTTRRHDGLTDGVLARGLDDPNMVYLVFKINSIAECNAALANPARLKLMHEGNVIGAPSVFFGRDEEYRIFPFLFPRSSLFHAHPPTL